MKARFIVFAVACTLWWLAAPGHAYSLMGPRWASGSSIVMHLQLGNSSGTLMDGSTSWNTVAEGALGRWGPFLNSVSFRVVRDSTAGIAMENGANNVFFADDIYGDAFGDAIAVTETLYRTS